MYRTIVPLFNRSVTPKTRDVYLKQFQAAGIKEILLALFGYPDDPADDHLVVEALRENIAFFQKHGIEAGVWIGSTIGHGVPLSVGCDFESDASKYTPMVDLAGNTRELAFCPLDEHFRQRIASHIASIATSGARMILLDDDFRMSQHGPEFCCTCERHMDRIRTLCGEDVRREDLKHLVFGQKANRYRHAWLTAQGESLELFASDIRKAVDRVNPDVRVGLCTAHALYGVDGTDPVRLARLLAGNTKPFLRLHGAPYWSRQAHRPMPTVLEMARAFAFLCDCDDVETVSEGDTYPRPRYNFPSAPLELFDAAMRIDGRHDGILKYMIDYNAPAEFEPSYVKRHIKNQPLLEAVSEMFDGKRALGLNVSLHRDLLADADLEIGSSAYYPYPAAGSMAAFSSIPTVYGEGGICCAVFGEEARHVSLDELGQGAVIDALAAQILQERGIDVGFEGRVSFVKTKTEYLTDATEHENAFIEPPDIRYAELCLNDDAKVVMKATINHVKKPLAYTYENADGAKFLVYCFDAMGLPRQTGLFRNYLQQETLKNAVEWISGKRLPAFVECCPDLYLMCKEGEGRMAVALINLFADAVDEPVIKLDREYRSIRFLNCSGQLEGDTVVLDQPIHAYTLAAFEVW